MNRLSLTFAPASSCAILCLMLVCVAAVSGQEPKRGFNPGGSYAISDIESISTSGGNLSLSVPLGALPAGRGGLAASVNLVYNSKLWDTYQETAYGPNGQVHEETRLRHSPDSGWRYAFKYDLTIDFKHLNDGLDYCDPDLGDDGRQLLKLMITLPDGSRHALRLDGRAGEGDYADVWPDGNAYCGGVTPEFGTLTYFSHDGTFLRLDIEHDSDQNWENNSWTLYLPGGGRVTGGNAPQRIHDRNNNYIEVLNGTYNGHVATYLNDQVGRSVIVEYNSASNQDSIHARGTNNEVLTWNVQWDTILVNKTYMTVNSPYNRQLNKSVKVVSQITIPAQAGGGIGYSFGYNANTTPSYGWGEMISITLPSGSKASYVYRLDGTNTVTSLNVAANNPTSKSLVYRPEYDLASGTLPSNSPCNTGAETCVIETWTYAFSFSTDWMVQNTTLTNPDGGVTRDYFNQESQDTKNYKTERADGTIVERHWQNNTPRTIAPIYVQSPATNRINPSVRLEFTSIKDAGGTLSKTAIKEYSQDKNGNSTEVKEYDWVAYASVPRDAGGKPTAVPTGAIPKRITATTYYNPTPDASDATTADPDSYHLTNTPRLHGLAQSSEVRDGSGVTRSRTEFFYDNTNAVGYTAATIGNLTQQKSWDSTKGAYSNPLTFANSVSASTQYNSYGSPTLTTDARGTQAQLTYGAVNGHPNLYPTTTKVAYGTSVEQVTAQEYDFYTGAVKRSVDPNGVVTATMHDAFGRPTLVRAAEGIAAKETRTETEYSDVNRRVIVRSDLTNAGDEKLVSVQHYDQLGRVRLSRQLEDAATESETDETAGVKVQTRYLYSGSNSYQLVSNPYRAAYSSQATGEPAMGWTRSKADNSGRTVEAQTFNGAALPAPWGANASGSGVVTTAYDAEFTIVTDQAGKKRRSMVNGLGQLARVDEPDGSNNLGTTAAPVQPTGYAYDALSNLTQVVQGTQIRTFNYSSLARLTSATNPESGHVNYTYDAGGNLLTKTDARSVTASYSYDALNRNTTVDYSDTATIIPDIQRFYDGAVNGKGRFWYQYKYSANSYDFSAEDGYDALGRPYQRRQVFNTGGASSPGFYTTRTYNRAGGVLTQTYPSGHTVAYNYDAAGRLNDHGSNLAFTGNLGDGTQRTYATGIVYNAAGRMTREQFGTQTPLYHKQRYNVRGQLYDVRLSSVGDADNWNRGMLQNHYSHHNGVWAVQGPDNNGNVLRTHHYIPNDEAVSSYSLYYQDYKYDALNRLQKVTETNNVAWAQQYAQVYDYDRWGNRTINAAQTWGTGVNNRQFAIDTATNRLGVPTGQLGTMAYDAAGNLTDDTYTGAGSRTFDAENRMTSAAVPGTNNSTSYYTYDADGRRVRRSTPTEQVWQVYGLEGELVAEYAAGAAPATVQKEYGYRNGELLVTAQGGATATVNVAAAAQGATASSSSNYPYGTYNAASTINGDRKGVNWGAGGGWNDGTAHVYADWLQVDFNGQQTITEINVFTCQDNYAAPSEPTLSQTFTLYGLTGYEVQYWTGGAWAMVPGAAVTGNDKVWRKFTFPALTTAKIRVLTNAGLASYSRITEVEAWSASAATSDSVQWLVADHLGTPRMIADLGGSLAGIRRRDYLPFGEEIGAGVGGRTQQRGYSQTDGVRQKFTSKERDEETGLDYFLARYYSSMQGRFTSPDEFSGGPDELYYFVDDAANNPTFYADLTKPQSLNKYQYAYNNPLRYVDPDGHEPDDPDQQQVVVRVPGGPPVVLPAPMVPGRPVNAPNPIEAINSLLDAIVQPVRDSAIGTSIRQIIGTDPDLSPADIPAPAMPQTGTPPSQQAQPMPPPPAAQTHKQKKQSTGSKTGTRQKHTDPRAGRTSARPPNFNPRAKPADWPKGVPFNKTNKQKYKDGKRKKRDFEDPPSGTQ